MTIEEINTKDYTTEYLKSRHNIGLVIQYLKKTLTQPASADVTNDSIRLLLDSLNIQSNLFLELNELPVFNSELRLENHFLKLSNKKLNEDLKKALKIKL